MDEIRRSSDTDQALRAPDRPRSERGDPKLFGQRIVEKSKMQLNEPGPSGRVFSCLDA